MITGKYRIMLLLILAFLLLPAYANAQCWYIRSVNSVTDVPNVTEISATINTVAQNASQGTMAFWIGYLSKGGGFVQLGYTLLNETAYHGNNCSAASGCSQDVLLIKSQPYWFYEYFPKGSVNTSFYGSFGSARLNASAHTYSIRFANSTFRFYVDGDEVGSIPSNVIVAANQSSMPILASEYFTTSNHTPQYIAPVTFKNISLFSNGIETTIYAKSTNGDLSIGNYSCQANPYGEAQLNSTALKMGSGIANVNSTQIYFNNAIKYSNGAQNLNKVNTVVFLLLLLIAAGIISVAYNSFYHKLHYVKNIKKSSRRK
ncbi:MAG: hypothetical protein QW814_02610 [Methanothrix sp.]